MSAARRSDGRFATTHWSIVRAAGDGVTPQAQEALAALCETYWYPLYAYLGRRGHDADAAQDLVQGFFAEILQKRALRTADPNRGRFRSFVLASLNHYVANERARASTLKRGGLTPPISIDLECGEKRYGLEPRDDFTPERMFERRWALTLLDLVLAKLRAEAVGAEKG